MPRKKRKFEMKDAEVPLSAMIDVVFLLLIYFIVSQKPIIENTLLGIDLPAPGSSASKDKPKQLLTIDVVKLPGPNSDDYYHVNQKRFHVNDLRMYLRTIGESAPDTTIIISCGPNAKHKKLVRLLDMCGEFKLTKLNLVEDETVMFIPEK